MELATGSLQDRYVVVGELGRGGMAVVYRAVDESLGREVAVKFIAENVEKNELVAQYFEREAKAAAALNHPNIVTIYDYGIHEGRPFMAMELVVGTTVEDLTAKQGRIVIVDALRIGTQVLSALEYAHEQKIIHRDIKPANFMCTEGGLTKLMDFGLAKSMDQQQKQTMIAGTPPYMSPEQLAGSSNDPRIDLFAVGVSLYEMISGQLPFEGLERTKPAIRLRELVPTVPESLDAMIHRSIEFEADKRFQTATEMLHPLRTLLSKASDFLGEKGKSMESLPPAGSAYTAEATAATMLGIDSMPASPPVQKGKAAGPRTKKGLLTSAGVYFHRPDNDD
ncbi:MAG: serine/threonine protein kinase [Myxococcales bacterium]|nr:serine/threonine protein kinase [Myxococcales bacterium]